MKITTANSRWLLSRVSVASPIYITSVHGIIIFVLQKKLNPRQRNEPAQGHTDNQWYRIKDPVTESFMLNHYALYS